MVASLPLMAFRFAGSISVILCCGLFAQDIPSQRGLEGFQLGQYLRTADATYAQIRIEKTTTDQWLIKGFVISERPNVSIIFQCPPSDPRRIHAIQVIGDPASRHPLFSGLYLGMDGAQVALILGKPTDQKSYKDGDHSYLRHDYGERNYSLEFDEKNRLISLMIWGYRGFSDPPPSMPKLEDLRLALKVQDLSKLSELFAPDVEVYRKGEVMKYEKSASIELQNNSVMKYAILGPGGLREALDRKDATEDFQLRMTEGKGNQIKMYSVCKFPNSTLLKEIVFTAHAGIWRVYEVSFRGSDGK